MEFVANESKKVEIETSTGVYQRHAIQTHFEMCIRDRLYTINAIDLAIEIGMGKRNNTILQSAFFSLAKVMPEEQAIQYMKDAATHSYLKKGQDVVDMNHKAIDLGATAYKKIDVPADWANAVDADEAVSYEGKAELVKQVKDILTPVDKMDGDSLPVSAFMPHVDGQWELGAAAYEKRGVAVSVPTWDAEKCIQCNNCAYVCPHATIRPFALTEEEVKNAPANAKIVDIKAGKGKGVYKYTMAISPLAVSYTHLDVYKRQLEMISFGVLVS